MASSASARSVSKAAAARRAARRADHRESARLAIAMTGPNAANIRVYGDLVIAQSATAASIGATVAMSGKWNGGGGSGARGAGMRFGTRQANRWREPARAAYRRSVDRRRDQFTLKNWSPMSTRPPRGTR